GRSSFTLRAPSTRASDCRASRANAPWRFATPCCRGMATMPSEGPRRLHPASLVFNLAAPLKALIVPAGLFVLPRGVPDNPWWVGAIALIVSLVSALVRYLTFTYEYGERELIVRSGLLFKGERHIPYGRIQNIDARQHLLHRLLRVQTIVIETGGGSEPEATLSVLDEQALDEMRRRVSAGGAAIG